MQLGHNGDFFILYQEKEKWKVSMTIKCSVMAIKRVSAMFAMLNTIKQ